jgi:CRISPR-associated protein Cas2
MVVISLTDCPPKLRGDLTKWLLEINTGVYCGQLSARVRDELWGRICENIKNGRATMVYSAPGEQRLDFKIHNTDWQPVDYDGIKLIMHPLPAKREGEKEEEQYISNAEKIRMAKHGQKKRQVQAINQDYCVIDLETTGLSIENSVIIEVGALKIRENQIVGRYSSLIKGIEAIPESITKLTGITDILIKTTGKELGMVLDEFKAFIGDDLIVGYHVNFDYSFLQLALEKVGKERLNNKQLDVLTIARKRLEDIPNYKLPTVAKHLGITEAVKHRAIQDCLTIYEVYNKLNKK